MELTPSCLCKSSHVDMSCNIADTGIDEIVNGYLFCASKGLRTDHRGNITIQNCLRQIMPVLIIPKVEIGEMYNQHFIFHLNVGKLSSEM